MIFPRYVKHSTSSRVSPSRVIGLLFPVLNLRTLVFPLFDWIMKTSTSERKHRTQWIAQKKLEDLNFVDDLALLYHTYLQMLMKKASIEAVSESVVSVLVVSDQWIRSILRKQLLINTCIFWMMAFVVLQVSTPYSRTVLTFVLKPVTLVLIDSCFELQMFFICKYAALALSTLAFTSTSDPPCSLWF
ncbi:unnamed protein product [Schistosoma curassoni]|uniref:Transmembrane protein n=1 Tax=Schistosoma curassoni TaxID=6186 RepID=A0A183JBH3_9TREM|nr:unnamed protein product [Schistosoma curassoni]